MAGEREKMEQIAGSNIVPYEVKKEVKAMEAQNRLYTQAIESGKTEEEAKRIVAESGIGSATPKLDRMAGEQRRAEEARGGQSDLGGFKTYGDKSTFEAKNAVRKLQGLEPLEAPLTPQNQFQVDLEKSASFGVESALTGQKGQARAFEAGVRAGYSPDETRKLIADTAARITGIVDQQKEKQQFVSDFVEAGKGAVPQPVGMLTPVERTSAGLDKSFFGGLGKNEPAAAPTPVAQQPTESPKSASQPPFFEQVYNKFKTPTLEELDKKNTGAKATFTPLGEPTEPKGLRAIGRGLERMRTPQQVLSDFMSSLSR